MKKYFVVLLFVLTSGFVPCLKADTQEAKTVKTEQVIPAKEVIQDKSSLQNFAYYFVFTVLFVAFAVWISRKSKEERNKIKDTIFGQYIVVLSALTLIMLPGSFGLSNCIAYVKNTSWLIFLALIAFFYELYKKKTEDLKGIPCHKVLNLSFYLFALYMFVNFFFYQVNHFADYNIWHQKAYAIASLIRILLLIIIICTCNLCFSIKNKERFFKIIVCISYGILIVVSFLAISSIDFSFSRRNLNENMSFFDVLLRASSISRNYIIGIKLPLILFFLSIMHLWQQEKGKKIFKNIGLFSVLCFVLMIWISFKISKRNIILGTLFSSGVFFYAFVLKNKYFSKKIKMFFCFIAVVLAFYGYKQAKIVFMYQTGLKNRIIEPNRGRLAQCALENFSKSKIFGIGVGNLDVGWPHNASFDLLASSGIVGLLLWYFPFLYTIGVFFKQKAYKNDINLIVFLFLGFTFFQSFFTGFYIFFTHLYFMLYFLIYRAKNKRS